MSDLKLTEAARRIAPAYRKRGERPSVQRFSLVDDGSVREGSSVQAGHACNLDALRAYRDQCRAEGRAEMKSQILGRLREKAGGMYSHATGPYYDIIAEIERLESGELDVAGKERDGG